MLIEINIGLLGAVAIVATLTGVFIETKFDNRWISYSIALFGASGVMSTVVLFDNVRAIVFNQSYDPDMMAYLTYGSLFTFLIGTEILVLITFIRFWKKGKVAKRR